MVAGFFAAAAKNPLIFVELLFWKTSQDVYELTEGYGALERERFDYKIDKGLFVLLARMLREKQGIMCQYFDYSWRVQCNKLLIYTFSDNSSLKALVRLKLGKKNFSKTMFSLSTEPRSSCPPSGLGNKKKNWRNCSTDTEMTTVSTRDIMSQKCIVQRATHVHTLYLQT